MSEASIHPEGTRLDGRSPLEIRPTNITTGFTKYAEGSVLIEVGATRVICTATIDERVPNFLIQCQSDRKGCK